MSDDNGVLLDTEDKWISYGALYDWTPPPKAAWYYRLPILRLFRFAYNAWLVERHYSMCIGIRTGYDDWVLFGIMRGWA